MVNYGDRQLAAFPATWMPIPAEVYTPCSCAAFIEQYRHFREWAYGFRRLPYAGEFFKVCGYSVQKLARLHIRGGLGGAP